MKEFNKILKSRIKNLPLYEPESKVWQAIERQLDFDSKLSLSLKKLPQFSPEEATWEQIENQLIYVRKFSSNNLLIGISVAASILILIGLWFFRHNSNNEIITVAQESSIEWHSIDDQANKDEVGIFELLNIQCKNNFYSCKDPSFIAKKQQLMEVEDELKKLRTIMKNSGSTPSMIKSCIKLENFKSELIKDLLNTLS